MSPFISIPESVLARATALCTDSLGENNADSWCLQSLTSSSLLKLSSSHGESGELAEGQGMSLYV